LSLLNFIHTIRGLIEKIHLTATAARGIATLPLALSFLLLTISALTSQSFRGYSKLHWERGSTN